MVDFDQPFPPPPPMVINGVTETGSFRIVQVNRARWPSFEALHEEVERELALTTREWSILRPSSGRSRLG